MEKDERYEEEFEERQRILVHVMGTTIFGVILSVAIILFVKNTFPDIWKGEWHVVITFSILVSLVFSDHMMRVLDDAMFRPEVKSATDLLREELKNDPAKAYQWILDHTTACPYCGRKEGSDWDDYLGVYKCKYCGGVRK